MVRYGSRNTPYIYYLINSQPHAGILIAKRRSSYEIAERIAILLDSLTADEIANQLLYI
ncbi:hypothetical protein [Tolypothrix sp. VBCCA 56010]|uniref:hypothetical protein n=1 Tax=Tolypothrix sp. VBCCA 56010 TaxID=3137731 RepID=UPI003D7C9E18